MSGHSKWATTHRQKDVADAKRGAIFTKLAKAITVASRLGGGDPSANFRLRLAIDQARAASMPKDNIERAIKRGTGELEGGKIETIVYEGFGPEGTAVLIECLTDNRNRSAASIKHLLAQHGGNFGGPNTVARLFEQKGVIQTPKITAELELELIDAGAADIITTTDETTIYTAAADLKKIKELLESKGVTIDYAEIEQVATIKKIISPAAKIRLQALFDALEDNEDVNNFYTNAEI